jgi:hypothetical protein
MIFQRSSVFNQTTYGKAFEFACLEALKLEASHHQHVEIQQDQTYSVAKNAFHVLDQNRQRNLERAATAAARHIVFVEPHLNTSSPDSRLLFLLQSDARGRGGDVRDVLCVKSLRNGWEIGISCKHNHDAVKHSRLSPTIDWGNEWLGIPCSENYWMDINPIFEGLNLYIANGELWRNIPRKVEDVYMPLLHSFKVEMERLHLRGENVPTKLVHYLLGRHDFYKVMSRERSRTTKIQAFSFNGTLGRSNGAVTTHYRELTRPSRLPTNIIYIDFAPESRNKLLLQCNEGWLFSFRIHNASSRVEQSLKFDIRLLGNPSLLYSHNEAWLP